MAMDRSVAVAHDNRFCNLVEFFWPGENYTLQQLQDSIIAAYSMMGSASIFLNTGAVFRSVDSKCIGCYELWIRDTNFAELEASTLAPVVASLTAVSPKYELYLTDVVGGGSKSGASQQLSLGKVLYIAECHMNQHQSLDDHDHQQRLLSVIKAFLDKQLIVEVQEGLELELKSYTVSRATDNPSKIVIIAECGSVEAAQSLAAALTNLPESPLRLHHSSTSSNVFEVVHIHHTSEHHVPVGLEEGKKVEA